MNTFQVEKGRRTSIETTTEEVKADYFNFLDGTARFYTSDYKMTDVHTQVVSVKKLPSKSSKAQAALVLWYLVRGLVAPKG